MINKIRISRIKNITIENNLSIKGGVEDLGNFKEGFCTAFRIEGENKEDKITVVCFSQYDHKNEFILKLTNLKMKCGILCETIGCKLKFIYNK